MDANKIVWTRRAFAQLEKAYRAMKMAAPFAGESFLHRVVQLVDELGRFPDIGRVVPEYGKTMVRERLFGEYRLIYMLEDGVVSILAFVLRVETDDPQASDETRALD